MGGNARQHGEEQSARIGADESNEGMRAQSIAAREIRLLQTASLRRAAASAARLFICRPHRRPFRRAILEAKYADTGAMRAMTARLWRLVGNAVS
ncbi:MAG TPA: hypothetical protein VN680_15085 [Burkholderiaceae bacterium]|jgi:hypothetical protein|nr:hypothetical protein [Burkholderiaceae bacterium]